MIATKNPVPIRLGGIEYIVSFNCGDVKFVEGKHDMRVYLGEALWYIGQDSPCFVRPLSQII